MARMAKTYFPGVSKSLAINLAKATSAVVVDMAVKSDQYVPEDTGKTRIEMKVDIPKLNVMWSNEYIEHIFWGIDMNFQTTHNPKARSMWTDKAINENIDDWTKLYADAILNSF